MSYETYKRTVTWQDVPLIYKRRLQVLGRALLLNLLAGALVVAVMILMPLYFGIAFLSGHYILTGLAACLAIIVSGKLYWTSLGNKGFLALLDDLKTKDK